jgi:hypothetical protein
MPYQQKAIVERMALVDSQARYFQPTGPRVPRLRGRFTGDAGYEGRFFELPGALPGEACVAVHGTLIRQK